MSILIEGVEMPKHDDEYCIFTVYGDGGVVYGPLNRPHVRYKNRAIHVPMHGRLIDESEFFARLDDGIKTISSLALPEDFVAVYTQLVKEVKEEIGKCRTVIPASEVE